MPLLILWLGYGEREATGTSLLVITLIARRPASRRRPATATSTSTTALLIGIPAVGGVLAGTWLQQRLPGAGVRADVLGAARRDGDHARGPLMIGTLLVGFAAGMLAGLLGIGGGSLFVPGLVLLVGLDQVDAEATSLLAIIPVAAVGAWRQHGYGNLRVREGLDARRLRGPGARCSASSIVNAIPERAVELSFAALLLYVAWTLAAPAARARGGRAGAAMRDRPARRPRPSAGGAARRPCAARPAARCPSCSASTAVPFGCERSSTAWLRFTRCARCTRTKPAGPQSSSSWPSGARSAKSPSAAWMRA